MTLLAGAPAATSWSGEPVRPNIVFVLTDDLGYGDLACFGHPEIQTPNLDQLAASGLKLTHCYAAAANCSPARAGIMTGRTPYRIGIYTPISETSPVHLRRSEITIATLLKQAGYATAMAGKWHLNGMFNFPSVHPQPNDHGFEYWFATQNIAQPNHRNPYNFVRNAIPLGRIEGYSAHIVADEAIAWLTKVRDPSKPFFLYVAFHEPHEMIATDPGYASRYRERHPDDPSRVAYYGNVTQMDDAFGRIMRTLDSQRLAGNTIVWFTSDNGPARTRWHNAGSSGGLREYKGYVYEGGIRVPGIIRWPGHIKPGLVSAEPVSGVDVLPTLCEITGIAPPADRTLDGISVLPLLRGEALRRPKPLYWQNIAAAGPKVAIRVGPWKLLAKLEGPRPPPGSDITAGGLELIKKGKLTGLELYNLQDDPAERTELSALRPQELAELSATMHRFHAGVQADAPLWPLYTNPREDQVRMEAPKYVAKPLQGERRTKKKER